MCGIAGAYCFTTKGTPYLNKIEAATNILFHRGPDGGGIYTDATVALGHRRLSIIDTSVSANQPMVSACGRYVVIYNGEIFNYQELRKTYLANQTFRTHSDTEVMLELYAKMGTASFEKLRGFFAAAFYDIDKKELVVVRDRFGKKPLHIYKDKDVFLFGSELKSILAFGIEKILDKQSLQFYLQFHYLPQPYGFLEGVSKLTPGQYMSITNEGVRASTYYQLKLDATAYNNYSYENACKKLETLMDEAVRVRLIADVPLGAFLSGGIDSSVVVAMASKHTSHLNTFAVGFKNNKFFDETVYANLVAKKFKTEHTTFSIHEDDAVQEIENILAAIDEPFADASAIPMYMLSKLVRQYVTVALSGDGGDEVFAGYNKHKADWYIQHGGVKKQATIAMSPVLKLLPQSRNHFLANRVRQLSRFATVAKLSPVDRYWELASFTSSHQVHQLLQKTISIEKPLPLHISGKDINEILLADMQVVLPGDMLVKTDTMSMANSLEVRCPFLDQEVIQFAFSLPASYKINRSATKRIVRDTFHKILPSELYSRPKQGFDIPLGNWLKNQLSYLLDDLIFSPDFLSQQGLFQHKAISQLVQKNKSNNPGDSPETLWALIVFQRWWMKNMIG